MKASEQAICFIVEFSVELCERGDQQTYRLMFQCIWLQWNCFFSLNYIAFCMFRRKKATEKVMRLVVFQYPEIVSGLFLLRTT